MHSYIGEPGRITENMVRMNVLTDSFNFNEDLKSCFIKYCLASPLPDLGKGLGKSKEKIIEKIIDIEAESASAVSQFIPKILNS